MVLILYGSRIRPLVNHEIRERTQNGRRQISTTGRKLIDGVPYGRTFIRPAFDRPGVNIPVRGKRSKLNDGTARAVRFADTVDEGDDDEIVSPARLYFGQGRDYGEYREAESEEEGDEDEDEEDDDYQQLESPGSETDEDEQSIGSDKGIEDNVQEPAVMTHISGIKPLTNLNEMLENQKFDNPSQAMVRVRESPGLSLSSPSSSSEDRKSVV